MQQIQVMGFPMGSPTLEPFGHTSLIPLRMPLPDLPQTGGAQTRNGDGEGEQPPQVLHLWGHLLCWARSQEKAQSARGPSPL